MVRALRSSLSARLGAVAVALSLTGAPALAARPERVEHRCQCRTHAGEHDCECARCHMGAAKQRGPTAAKQRAAPVPPCHARAAAGDERAPARPAPPGGPCITGTCGGLDGVAAPPTALDAFTLAPPPSAAGLLPPTGRVAPPSGTARDAPCRPELPPPRSPRTPAARA